METPLKSIVTNAMLVGVGGFVGAILRYGLGGLIHRRGAFGMFPVGTLSVNLIGCLLIGLLAGLAESRHALGPDVRTFALIGLLGGFTTFSTFGYETFAMARDHEFIRAATNVGIHVVFGLVLVWVGYAVASR